VIEKVYFNHSGLIAAPFSEVRTAIVEIHRLKNILKSIPMYVHENFWELPIQGGTLKTYLMKRNNKEEAILFILALMHNGPHYHDSPIVKELSIVPLITGECFARILLHICYNDDQPHIVSLSSEKDLVNSHYTISTVQKSMELFNFIGEYPLLQVIEGAITFGRIGDVFQKVKETDPTIEILPSALKSAGKHNFKGAFQEVFNTITGLRAELSRILEGESHQSRIEAFRRETGYEISPESTLVSQNFGYKSRREFTIPRLGKKYFEWHIKIGNETRIHYYIDKEKKKIYIGHCGKHLPVPSYRS